MECETHRDEVADTSTCWDEPLVTRERLEAVHGKDENLIGFMTLLPVTFGHLQSKNREHRAAHRQATSITRTDSQLLAFSCTVVLSNESLDLSSAHELGWRNNMQRHVT